MTEAMETTATKGFIIHKFENADSTGTQQFSFELVGAKWQLDYTVKQIDEKGSDSDSDDNWTGNLFLRSRETSVMRVTYTLALLNSAGRQLKVFYARPQVFNVVSGSWGKRSFVKPKDLIGEDRDELRVKVTIERDGKQASLARDYLSLLDTGLYRFAFRFVLLLCSFSV